MTHPSNEPPSYDEVTEAAPAAYKDIKFPLQPESQIAPKATPSSYTMPGSSNYLTRPIVDGHSPIVYRYVNPTTGEQIASLLPPHHPEMVCMQSGHVLHTNYGILGILAAVFWFPLGVGLCLLDRRVKCTRCGATVDEGVCG